MEVLILPLLVLVGVVCVGAICGITAMNRIGTMETRLRRLENRQARLDASGKAKDSPAPSIDTQRAEESTKSLPGPETPSKAPIASTVPPPLPSASAPAEQPAASATPAAEPNGGLAVTPVFDPVKLGIPKLDEITLGTKWLVWIGVVLTLIGTALFLKYAYDNDWIRERERLAIGVGGGIISLGFGERFRRKDWRVLFQALTGGGIATFYVCVYFSFQVYGFTGQTVSMALASLVTLLAVMMAVGYNAVSIAILGVIGGFLSPVLLSTGENHPYGLFTYIAILNLVAIGVAYFRHWRALDVFCFACTALLFQAWRLKFYVVGELPPDQFNLDLFCPALLYTSVFYVMFLVIPMLHSLVKRTGDELDGLVLLVANSLFSLSRYHYVLFDNHRHTLGLVVLGQAMLVFLLLQAWRMRVRARNRTTDGLLIIGLALVTLVVPIELKLYTLAIAWAVEGVVVVYLGIRFRNIICKVGGGVALILAVYGLLMRLPLHESPLIPVFNVPFGSWVCVVACAMAAAHVLHLMNDKPHPWDPFLGAGAFLLGFVLGCALLTMETSYYWVIGEVEHYEHYLFNSLAVLWAAITFGVATMTGQKRSNKWTPLTIQGWMPLCVACYLAGLLIFVMGLRHYRLPDYRMLLNWSFGTRLLLALSFWWGASRLMRVRAVLPDSPRQIAAGTFLAGLVQVCVLLTLDVVLYWAALGIKDHEISQFNSLAVLWALIASIVAIVIGRKRLKAWIPLAMVCYAVAAVVFLAGLTWYETRSTWLMVNWTFATRLLIPVSFWLGSAAFVRLGDRLLKDTVFISGHIVLSVLLAFEFYEWSKSTQVVSEHMGVSLISAAWAVQAFVLIWLGLAMRNRSHRILGFVVFGVTITKVCLVDTSTLEPVHRIVSFLVSGLLAIVAGYFYQRYLPVLLGDTGRETEP